VNNTRCQDCKWSYRPTKGRPPNRCLYFVLTGDQHGYFHVRKEDNAIVCGHFEDKASASETN
jgi:hypothetical protein